MATRGGSGAWVRKNAKLVAGMAGLVAFGLLYALLPPFRAAVDGGLCWALGEPRVLLPVLFLYSILIAVVLPIPVELVLINPAFSDPAFFAAAALTIGAGKAVGAFLIFHLGVNLEGGIRRWSERLRFFALLVRFCEWLVRKTNYVGLYLLLSIPFMTDTAILYIYALFNPPADPQKAGAGGERHALRLAPFILTNFLGGVTRVALFLFVFLQFFPGQVCP
jgi:membrane protein YqaA with SNARE-associated domain